jgi:hypothetical protein
MHTGPSRVLDVQIRMVELCAATFAAWGRAASRPLQLARELVASEVL